MILDLFWSLNSFTSVINQDCQPFLSTCGARREVMIGSGFRNIQLQQSDEPWKSIIGLSESKQFVQFDAKVRSLEMVDAQG